MTVDTAEFETAMVNLVINARDAMPNGTNIANRRAARELTPNDRISGTPTSPSSITDNGDGIPPDALAKVFDPFFTTKPVGKGTGLGLSQVHGFAHQAGGTVKAGSELGRGTEITITLPRESAAPNGRGSTAETNGRGTVLLVEDNPDVAYRRPACSSSSATPCTAWRMQAALHEIEHPDGIDLVLTDIVMPGKMDGLALAHPCGRAPRTYRSCSPPATAKLTQVRADFPILRKPYEIHQLSQAIAKLPR